MTDENITQDDNLRLADLRFKASRGDDDAMASLKDQLVKRKALPFYSIVATELVRLFLSLFTGWVSFEGGFLQLHVSANTLTFMATPSLIFKGLAKGSSLVRIVTTVD